MSCPMCGKETDQKSRPFCSRRCADIDLSKWLNGAYAVPSQDEDDIDELEQAIKEAVEEDARKLPN